MYWMSKMLVRYILSSVSSIMSILAIIFHAIYGAVCIQFTYFSFDDCENTLFNYHHRIGSMTHLSRVMSWNIGVRCMSFYIRSYCRLRMPPKFPIIKLNWTDGYIYGFPLKPKRAGQIQGVQYRIHSVFHDHFFLWRCGRVFRGIDVLS